MNYQVDFSHNLRFYNDMWGHMGLKKSLDFAQEAVKLAKPVTLVGNSQHINLSLFFM